MKMVYCEYCGRIVPEDSGCFSRHLVRAEATGNDVCIGSGRKLDRPGNLLSDESVGGSDATNEDESW